MLSCTKNQMCAMLFDMDLHGQIVIFARVLAQGAGKACSTSQQ